MPAIVLHSTGIIGEIYGAACHSDSLYMDFLNLVTLYYDPDYTLHVSHMQGNLNILKKIWLILQRIILQYMPQMIFVNPW